MAPVMTIQDAGAFKPGWTLARLFAEADLGKLEEKSAAVMDRLLDAARKHNRIGEDLVTESEKN